MGNQIRRVGRAVEPLTPHLQIGLQFNEAGDYSYYDAFSFNSGVVHVGTSIPNNPPHVAISEPTNGAVLTAPASFTLTATASDLDSGDGILWVEFHLDDQLLDYAYASPFSVSVTNLLAGIHTLSAIAYDYSATPATNSVTITVQTAPPPAMTLGDSRIVAGEFRFAVGGLTASQQIVLLSSTNLPSGNWIPVGTNTVESGQVTFTNAAAPGNQFFRVMLLH